MKVEGRKKTQAGRIKFRLQRGNRNPEARHSRIGIQGSIHHPLPSNRDPTQAHSPQP